MEEIMEEKLSNREILNLKQEAFHLAFLMRYKTSTDIVEVAQKIYEWLLDNKTNALSEIESANIKITILKYALNLQLPYNCDSWSEWITSKVHEIYDWLLSEVN